MRGQNPREERDGREAESEGKAGARGKEVGRMNERAGRGKQKSLGLAVILATMLAGPTELHGDASEYVVKAAFLIHFAQFVEWPPEAFKDASSPLMYCTIGEDPFGGALEESVKGKSVGGRALQVQHLKGREQIGGCHILFIGGAEKKHVAEDLSSAAGHAVLTVGETEHFAQSGGVIGFLVENEKIRFEINLQTARKTKLKISSRLLSLAKTVIEN
jgi:hypothetical protein